MSNTPPDVLVVGAGPVGLTMAAELARNGISCRIIDRLAQPLPFCRAIGITPRTLEVWDDMGVVRPVIDAGLWLRGQRSIINQTQTPDVVRDLADLPYGHLGIPQPETERILTEHLSKFGIKIERPVTLTNLQQDANQVQVELSHPDGTAETATFRYVVGCDGAHSAVRKLLGIEFEGDKFPIGFMLGDVHLDYDFPRGMSLRSVVPHEGAAPDFFVAIPLTERNRFRVSMLAPMSDPDPNGLDHGLQTEAPGPSLEELQAVADRLLPNAKLSDLRWSSNFRISMRLASHYRVGRGFIAGDAAHIHPPTGGQGMNTGIQDAYNLAWKLALVLKGAATSRLLDTYEEERRPIGADVVARTRVQSEQYGRQSSEEEKRLADTQILVNYHESRLSHENAAEPSTIRAGDRAPDCSGLLRENIRSPMRLFDLTRGIEHVMLLYVGDFKEPGQAQFVEALAERFKRVREPRCRLAVITSPKAEIPWEMGITIVIDTTGEFATAYAPANNSAYLVRPDGYIGYHGRPLTDQGFVGYMRELAG